MSMWIEFERIVWADQTIRENQRREGRRVFYAGAGAMLACCKQIGDESINEEDGAQMFERLQAEIDSFLADEVNRSVLRKRATP